uniref:lysine-specific demethylase JMJ25-like n=1 Tax=Erigeron canadensis TaxID=72917 RepID=UPI001CB9CE70|nr:lysine-specific demethylase JMJ25-like [Erigeron canadensis]
MDTVPALLLSVLKGLSLDAYKNDMDLMSADPRDGGGWIRYPNVSEEQFAEACPVCCDNCNCRSCLHGLSPKDKDGYTCSGPDKIQYSEYILQKVFPLVRSLNEAQLAEKEIEAKFNGLSVSELKLEYAECEVDEDMFCNNCGAYFFDLYRSCACGYDLCLGCCRDLRDDRLMQLHDMPCGWKALIDGSIPCPPKDIGGCNFGILELKHIMPSDWVAKVLEEAQEIYTTYDIPEASMECCMCYNNSDMKLEREAMQEKRNASYLYTLKAKDIEPRDMQHFQLHWSKGEPVIVSDVLSTSSGLSWEPMVLWRAFHDTTTREDDSLAFEVNAINCLDWSEVNLDLYEFFRGYLEGGTLKLKLENWWPFCLSDEEWPRHFVEIMRCLPFKDYTHPYDGYLNVAVKLPRLSLKPDTGPMMDIAYGGSVTKLRCDSLDTVNVLTHTSIKLNKKQTLKRKHDDQDEVDRMDEVAKWDIFRRQDIPKLEQYLRKYFGEVRANDFLLVVHPLHDRAFYLKREHKRKLKMEFGVEPWTFKQKLGDAVLIPAGCPYQIRNLKSCTKVEFYFVSPESLGECLRLQQELRMLPNNHRANSEKLNIWKLIVYALDHSLADLAVLVTDPKLAMVPYIPNGNDADNYNHTRGRPCNTDNDEDESIGLWQGNAVETEAKELLQAIKNRYPNTFHRVRIRSKEIWMPILKQFYLVIKGFMETYVDTLMEDQITHIREDLNELECFGFNLAWAHERLNIVEKLKFVKDPLQQELMDLEESLELVKKCLVEQLKEFVEAHEKLKKVRLDYDNITEARNKKAREVAQKFGGEYDHLCKGQLGSTLLPGYCKI